MAGVCGVCETIKMNHFTMTEWNLTEPIWEQNT